MFGFEKGVVVVAIFMVVNMVPFNVDSVASDVAAAASSGLTLALDMVASFVIFCVVAVQ